MFNQVEMFQSLEPPTSYGAELHVYSNGFTSLLDEFTWLLKEEGCG
jgi:hypothetical protein